MFNFIWFLQVFQGENERQNGLLYFLKENEYKVNYMNTDNYYWNRFSFFRHLVHKKSKFRMKTKFVVVQKIPKDRYK